jgi:hypothetical protein
MMGSARRAPMTEGRRSDLASAYRGISGVHTSKISVGYVTSFISSLRPPACKVTAIQPFQIGCFQKTLGAL